MKTLRYLLSLLAMHACAAPGAEPDPHCSEPVPLRVSIRIAGGPAQPALLVGGSTPGLRLTTANGAIELWSAGPQAGATQPFGQMTAAYGHSLTAIDLNGDGTHDRLYAGDRLGRLWRFDLDGSAPVSLWASGGVIADFGAVGMSRGFIAAPDVALFTDGNRRWLNIAIGTASVGEGLAANRFYVFRDHAAFEQWGPLRYRRLVPVTEADLQQVQSPLGDPDPSGPGYFIDLGSRQILASSLTLGGSVHFTVAETPRFITRCAADGIDSPTTLSISVVRGIDGSIAHDLNADGHIDREDQGVRLPGSLPSHARIELIPSPDPGVTRHFCTVGGLRIEACSLDTSPHRTYWRREDAD